MKHTRFKYRRQASEGRLAIHRLRGFTLVELMVTLAVVALLVALALPGYQSFVRKANRGEAQQLLMNWANLQEIWRSNNASYTSNTANIPLPTHDKYNFSIADVTATTYTLTATIDGSTTQAGDKQAGTDCTPMTLDESNTKTPGVCW